MVFCNCSGSHPSQVSKTPIALSVTAALAGAAAVTMAALQVFGAIGSIGFLAGALSGGAVVLGAASLLVYLAVKSCKTPTPVRQDPAPTSDTPTEAPQLPKEKPSELPLVGKPVNTPKITSEEQVELHFWETHFENRELGILLEMAVNNAADQPNKCAEFLVDHYENYLKQKKSSISLSTSDKKLLIRSVVKQFSHISKPKRGAKQTLAHPRGQLAIYPTVGDGSCGLHALLGMQSNGRYQTDAQKYRNEFCDWLKQQHKNKTLPPQITMVLDDYFYNFNLAPYAFQQAVREKHQHYTENYERLSQFEKDGRLSAFKCDEVVFDAYLNNLRKVGTYLLQEELIAAAICFNKRLVLHQHGWGSSQNKVSYAELTESGETVDIWYNGYNHYERAEIVSGAKTK